jgi:hypothetical protein
MIAILDTLVPNMDDVTTQFVICINNESNPASLILGKVYRVLRDEEAELYNMIRIVDEDTSEPDGYLYPSSLFAPIEVSEGTQQTVLAESVRRMARSEILE